MTIGAQPVSQDELDVQLAAAIGDAGVFSDDESAGITGAASPSAENVFATMADLPDLAGYVAPESAGIDLETDADFTVSADGNFSVTAAAVQIAETGGGWSIGGSGSGSVFDGDGLAPDDRPAIPTQVTTVSVDDFNTLRTALIAFGLILDGD
jgi:hypothetical protein